MLALGGGLSRTLPSFVWHLCVFKIPSYLPHHSHLSLNSIVCNKMFDEGDLLTPTSTPRTPVQAEGYSTPPDAGTAMHAAFSLTPMKQCHSTRKRRNSGGESPSKRGPGTPTVSSPPHAGMGNWQLPPAPQARTHRTAVPLRSSSPVPFGGSCSTASLCVSRNDSDAMAQQWGGSFTNCTPEEPLETQDSFTIAGLNRIKPRTLDPSIATVYDVHSEDSDGSDTETESSSEEDPDCSRFAEDLVELCELGRGSYGVVYKVRHVLDQQIYAVKKGHRPVAGVVRKENCLQEVYSLAALPRCLHIIKYHDCWFEQRCLHIRFEYCEGGTIASVPPTAWTYDKLLTLFFQMSTGLKCLHQENIVHLDVKPENVFITEASGETVYKLGDFGLVRKIQRQTGTNEQWLGENHEEGDSRYLCQAFLRGVCLHTHLCAPFKGWRRVFICFYHTKSLNFVNVALLSPLLSAISHWAIFSLPQNTNLKHHPPHHRPAPPPVQTSSPWALPSTRLHVACPSPHRAMSGKMCVTSLPQTLRADIPRSSVRSAYPLHPPYLLPYIQCH